MAESAVATPPVPKPRTSRPTPTPPTPTLSPPTPAEHTDGAGDFVRELSPDPPPYSSLLSPSPTQHTDSDSEASLSDIQVVVRRKKTTPTSLDKEDDDYENIDAILDDETRENVRRSNYINWVYQDTDGDEGQNSQGAERLGHDRYAPSIKLDRHPALKKSQSNSEIDADAATAAAQFIDALRRRPRNKAPPPPPGKRGTKDKGQSSASPSSGHKRSHSDLHLSAHSQEPGRLNRPHPPAGGQRLPGYQSPGQKRGVAKPPPVPANQRSPENMRYGRNSPLLGVRGGPKEAANVKPKRHAPPPPTARRSGTPEYAIVNKQRTRTGDQSDPTPRRWSKTSSNDSAGPPKPLRAHRAQSIEDLSQTASPMQDRSVGVANRNSLLDNMDVFTLELRKEPQVSFGLVIVSGKVRRSTGESTLEGVFIQKVVPNSPADNDGRIQPGDMLLEVGGRGTMGGVLSETIDLLKGASESIRLKIARPDVLSSVFAVEGGDEQPIYENKILPPAEMLLKLHQTEGRVLELEMDKERATIELLALREETQREKAELNNQLEDMRRELDDTKRESEVRSGELTQALASVTVGRTKAESEVEKLRSEISTLRDKLNEASEIERELQALKENNSSLVSELAREKQLSTQLQERLDIAESARDSDTEEIAKLCKKLETQEKQITSLKSELEQLRNTRVTPVRAAHVTSDPSPLDKTCVKEVVNGNGSHNDNESCDSDDAFDNSVPSPVTPSPYLDFVPLEEKGRKERKKDPGSKPAKKPEECSQPPTEGEEGVANADDLSDPTAATIAEFDAMTLNAKPLNSSAAIHKSQVGRKLLRKKPSRQHLKNMGSSFDILEGLPEIETPPTTETNEQGPPHSNSNSTTEQPPSSVGENEGKIILGELSTSTDINKTETVIIPEVHHETPPPQPKPRPRARVRHMPSLDDKKPPPPQAAPRHREPTIEGGGVHSREGSPLPTHKPLVPPPAPVSAQKPLVPPPTAHKPLDSSHATSQSANNSPLLKKKEPILPSPKHLPKSPKMPPNVELKLTEDSGDIIHPTAHPRHLIEQPPQEIEEESIPAKTAGSDSPPVVIRAISAPGSPAKARLPPPVSRKPKSGEDLQHNHDGQLSPKRSMSFDDELEASPQHRKKMPAGAVNIMGFLPVTTKLKHLEIGGGGRERSCTVSTTEPGARERDTLKRQIEKHEASPISHTKPVEEETTPPVQDEDPVVIETKKLPPKRPPLPTAKKPANNVEQVDGPSSDDWDSDASPMLATKMEHQNEAGLDYSSVLSWTPEGVGLWMDRIGLGRYQNVFVERGVAGGDLFDIDGHSLKGMGMESHEDRSVFKRELKNLKPFADKQRKAIEKQKKEEKKIAKKLKKK